MERRPAMTEYEILQAYSGGRLSSGRAIAALDLEGHRELLIAVARADLSLPKPPPDEVREQVDAALPLLRAALRS